jgi:hypothetical protein
MTVLQRQKREDEQVEPQVTQSLPDDLVRRAMKGSNASQAELARRVRQDREAGGPVAKAANPFSGTMLKIGASGAAVEYLQNALNGKGASLGVDGAFGGQTLRAVTSFQASAGLGADGIVGPQTWGAMAKSGAKVEDEQGGEETTETKGPTKVEKQPPPVPATTETTETKSEKEVDEEIEAEDETEGGDQAKTDGEKFREAYVQELLYFEGSQEHGHQSDRFQEVLPTAALQGAREQAAASGRTFTTCNTFSGILQSRVEAKTGVKLLQKINLHIMDPAWREKNLPPGAFVKCEPGTGERPQAGDIVILCGKDGFTFKHMGNMVANPVVNEDGTEQWDCVDGGQGQAHDASGKNANEAILRIGYTYNPQTAIVTKPPYPRERMIYGWVDIAKLAGG